MNREDLELYVMGMYEGDVAALERELADDPAARAIVADEARLDLLLRDAAATAAFCPACDDLVRGARCDACGAAVRPGGYTVERVLVSNAHGRMYAARDVDGKQVALKELAFVQSPTPAALAAFEREAKFLRALEHPAIPRFCASFEEGTGAHVRYYLAQELVAGEALADRLEAHWFSEAEIRGIARQVLDVLVYLQGLSPMVIHRDIKPANLLARPDGTIAVVDFGAAHGHGMTATSTAVGTFGYMPIEQLAGEVDATTDLYALGASLIHLLTRREPWRILQDGLLADAQLNVGRPMRAFLCKLVAPNPRDRFRSAALARAALDRLDRGRFDLVGRMRPARVLPARLLAHPWAVVGIAVAVAATAAGGAMLGHARHMRKTSARVWVERHRIAGTEAKAQLADIADEMCQCTDQRCITKLTHRLTDWGREIAPSADWAMPEATRELNALSERISTCVTRVVTEAIPHDPAMIELERGSRPRLVYIPSSGLLLTAVHDAVQAIGESCDMNVVMSGAVASEATGKLSRVPCDRALDVLLRSTDLAYEVHDASIVRIAPRVDLLRDHAVRADRVRRGIVDDRLPAGRDVDLDMKRQPVRDAIHMLAQAGGVEVTLPDHLDATVTIHVNHVSWERALVAILEASDLGYRYDGPTKKLRIGPRAEVDAERATRKPHGFLEITRRKDTSIEIDEVDTDIPADGRIDLPVGLHAITFTRPNGDRMTHLVNILEGKTARVGN